MSKKKSKPYPAFTALVKDAKDTMSLSWGSDTQKDDNGNEITVFLWVSGDWKVEYKGKEYLIPMSENVNALIDWINKNENA